MFYKVGLWEKEAVSIYSMVEVYPIIGLGNKSLALNENANYNSFFWPYLNIPLLSCLCFSEHNNLSDHLLHMSRDFSPFKFYYNC